MIWSYIYWLCQLTLSKKKKIIRLRFRHPTYFEFYIQMNYLELHTFPFSYFEFYIHMNYLQAFSHVETANWCWCYFCYHIKQASKIYPCQIKGNFTSSPWGYFAKRGVWPLKEITQLSLIWKSMFSSYLQWLSKPWTEEEGW